VLRHLYAFVLGLSLFGNPVAVLESFTGGIKALFYEPYRGAVLGPEEFVLGLGIGVKNFLGYTLGICFSDVVNNLRLEDNDKDLRSEDKDLSFEDKDKDLKSEDKDLSFEDKDKDLRSEDKDLSFEDKDKDLKSEDKDLSFEDSDKELRSEDKDLSFEDKDKDLKSEDKDMDL